METCDRTLFGLQNSTRRKRSLCYPGIEIYHGACFSVSFTVALGPMGPHSDLRQNASFLFFLMGEIEFRCSERTLDARFQCGPFQGRPTNWGKIILGPISILISQACSARKTD